MKLLNIKEVAGILRVSDQTVRSLIARGELRGKKVGKEYRLLESDVREFVEGEDKNFDNSK